MKYELKRQIGVRLICCLVPLVIGLLALFNGEYLSFAILLVISIVLTANEIIRIKKDEKFTFDENGFRIGDAPYRYDSIEKIDSNRWRHLLKAKIIVDGKIVYRFDNDYENYKEFAKQLTLHNVEHDLFS